jgi:hypothetical protein
MTDRNPRLLPDGVRLRSREAEAIRDLARDLATLGLDNEERRRQLVACAQQIEQLADVAIELIAQAHH